jgi:hypothetical protein
MLAILLASIWMVYGWELAPVKGRLITAAPEYAAVCSDPLPFTEHFSSAAVLFSGEGKEAAFGQDNSLDATAQPLGGGHAVKTIPIKLCPEGYELVTRANRRRGCARDVLPARD